MGVIRNFANLKNPLRRELRLSLSVCKRKTTANVHQTAPSADAIKDLL